MPELLDFDKDLVHLEAASKVCLICDVLFYVFLFVNFSTGSVWITTHHLVQIVQIQLKSLAEEMQAVSKGLEKVEQELAASENDGAISSGFQKVRNCQERKSYRLRMFPLDNGSSISVDVRLVFGPMIRLFYCGLEASGSSRVKNPFRFWR